MTLFERTKQTAKERGLTLRQVEEQAGLGQNSLYAWKKYTPKGSNLQKVAGVLGVSVDYLLGNTDEKRSVDWDDIFQYNVERYRDLISEVQEAINNSAPYPNVDSLKEDGDELITLAEKVDADILRHYAKVIKDDVKDKTNEVSVPVNNVSEILVWMSDQTKKEHEEQNFLMDNHWQEELKALPDEERKKVISAAKAYIEGMIEAYSHKGDSD